MKYFFAGAEIPSHRKVLAEVGAQDVALSYMGLRRRVKFARPWLLDDKFPTDTNIFLDSGAYTVNRDESSWTNADELIAISQHYQEFVRQNIDRVDMVSEFDLLRLGYDWVKDQRDSFYDHLPREKFLPIWHPVWGLDLLREMGREYQRIGVVTTDLNGRDLTPLLNSIASDGVSLHGVAITSVDQMSNIHWSSVSSTSWISPQQYGDTIVWTGRELKRYPKKYKEQARKRYRTLFEEKGFDSRKIEEDDSTEVLRLSIWSWQRLVSDIEYKRHNGLPVVTTGAEPGDDEFTETQGDAVDTSLVKSGTGGTTEIEQVTRRETVTLPGLGLTKKTMEVTGEDGELHTEETTQVSIRSDSQRMCSSCYLSSKCPAFDAGSNCAYDIPVEVRTRDQFIAVQNALIEMQTQRVFFMRFAEDQEGGYADPNLSTEMDRLQKMLKTKNDMESEGFSFRIEGKQVGGQQGGSGLIARLFGDDKATEAVQALPSPMSVEQVMDITDADIIEGS